MSFTNAIFDYRVRGKTRKEDTQRAINRLNASYDILRIHGCILDGRATKRRLAEKDEQIGYLDNALEDAIKKLGVMEHRLSECADEKIGLENTNKAQKEELDAIRAEDIRNSLGSSKSKLDEGEKSG